MNCVIIDDDKLSTKIISEFINRTEGLVLVESYSNPIDAINALNKSEKGAIQLIFLDIEMPEMTGIEFIKALHLLPQVIIYSSKEKYALESYEYNVTDYLLKPVSYARFLKAVTKVQEKSEAKDVSKKPVEFFIKNNQSLIRVKFEDILWVEALENYVVLNTFTDKYTAHFTMKAMTDKMPEDSFVRIHRSFIINTTKIKMIENNTIVVRTEQGDKVLPIGKSYKDKLLDDINLITR